MGRTHTRIPTSIQQTLTGSATAPLDPTASSTPAIVLADRYAFSGIAFSNAKGLPYTPQISPSPFQTSPFSSISLQKWQESERGGYGQERYEKEEMQKKVGDVFLRMASEMRGTTASPPEEQRALDRQRDQRPRVTIDAGRSVEQVTNDISNPSYIAHPSQSFMGAQARG